jgi:hypothetical protein
MLVDFQYNSYIYTKIVLSHLTILHVLYIPWQTYYVIMLFNIVKKFT